MTLISEEHLSAFLDGELPGERIDVLLSRLDSEPAERARLARYALIGECLRGGSADPGGLVIAERVRRALAHEQVAKVPHQAQRLPGWNGWVAAAFATAAAAVAVVVGPASWWGNGQERVASTVVTPMAAEQPAVIPVPVPRADPLSAERLTGYLVAHGEYASTLSRSTLDSHLVTARAERASWRQTRDPLDARQ